MQFLSCPPITLQKLRNLREREGCLSLRSLASIWRMRSRVTLNCWPTSSSVWSVFMPMSCMRSTRSSRAVRLASTRVVVSRRLARLPHERLMAFLSSMKSPRWLSSSSPIGVSSESVPWHFQHLRTLSIGIDSFSASSSRWLGTISCSIWRRCDQLVDRLDHMHRNADGARLIGNRPSDRLTDPPGGIGGEFVTAMIFATCRPPSSGRYCLPE